MVKFMIMMMMMLQPLLMVTKTKTVRVVEGSFLALM